MKNRILFIFLLIFSTASNGQMIYAELFDMPQCAGGSGCPPSSVGWTVTQTGSNGATANAWYISGTSSGQPGNCDAVSSTDQTLHIANVAGSTSSAWFCPNGDCGAAYDATSSAEITDIRVESPVINLSGKNNVLLSFHYIENGENSDDNAEAWYFDGSSWSMLVDMPKTNLCGGFSGLWESFDAMLPSSADNNPNVKIGFRWINDGDGVATDPSISINDITLINNFNSVNESEILHPEVLVNGNSVLFNNISDKTVEIFDITGKLLHLRKNNITYEINVPGIYFVRIFNDVFSMTQKIIIQ